MAKKTSSKSAASATASGSSHAKTPSVPSNTVHVASSTPAIKKPSISSNDHIGKVLLKVFNDYFDTAPGRVRLIDAFMAFLVALGVFQFGICIIIGTYPFNAFLGGLASTVGQFVLLAGLRIQTTKTNSLQFPSVTPERAFADFVVGSLFLHFTVLHFIN